MSPRFSTEAELRSVQLLSRVRLLAASWAAARHAELYKRMEIKEMGYVSISSWQYQCVYERKIENREIGLHSNDRFLEWNPCYIGDRS